MELSWALLHSSGLSCARLGSPEFSWALLGSPGLSWVLWGSPGIPWALLTPLSFDELSWAVLCSPEVSWGLLCSPGDEFSVVRRSRMGCPHNIGRDSWVWGEQETLWKMNSPHEVGEEPLTEKMPLSGGSGVAQG